MVVGQEATGQKQGMTKAFKAFASLSRTLTGRKGTK
jgi:hypothetical protein